MMKPTRPVARDREPGRPPAPPGAVPLAALARPWVLTPLLALVTAGAAAAADPTFPRGPGFYFSSLKLLAGLFGYLCWVRTCWWVDQDTADLKLPRETWNLFMLGSGLLGLLVLWLLPWFWVSFLVFLALYLTPTLVYVSQRNEQVDEADKVLTRRHLRELGARLLGMRVKEKAAKDTGPQIKFIAKDASRNTEDPARVARAEQSKGYRAAKEMVWDALQGRATDIHMEPTKDEMIVRFRIDGILEATTPFSRQMGESVVNIFKVLAALDITEKRKPQDGSLSALVDGKPIDFRAATAGSVSGEKLVLRILDKSAQMIDLPRLGMRDKLRDEIRKIIEEPHGMFIVCGPTGAGKSTTLYAGLQEIDRFQRNVITIENPVEYHLDNVTQIEINPKAGKTFATELRSILRQDPDVILIGEIRDQETAETACQAAQTGHMVFSTLHANDTITAIGRLMDLHVAPYLISSALTAVLGQRLVRLLCPKCKVRYKPKPELLQRANLPTDQITYFYRPPGGEDDAAAGNGKKAKKICSHCGGTGYRGRTGIFELLVVNEKMREMIRENPNLSAIKQEAVRHGMVFLQQDGMRKVIEGKTSIQELLRVSK